MSFPPFKQTESCLSLESSEGSLWTPTHCFCVSICLQGLWLPKQKAICEHTSTPARRWAAQQDHDHPQTHQSSKKGNLYN